MDVEHGGQGHVDVGGPEAARRVVATGNQQKRLGMEHELAVREVDALGEPGGPGGVERGGPGVLVEILEIIRVGRSGQHRLVLAVERDLRCRLCPVVGDEDNLLDGGQLVPDRFQQGQEVLVDKDDLVLGVVHRVEDLLRRKPPVLGVQDRLHHGDGEEALHVAVAVIVKDADDIPFPDAQFFQAVGQAVNPFVHFAVGQAHLVAVDDLLIGGEEQRRFQDVLDQQLVVVMIARFINLFCHVVSSFFRHSG